MAQKLDNFDFSESERREYPWDEWEDGSPWLIVQGEDFGVSIKSMSAQLTIRANSSPDKSVRQRVQKDPAGIVFQFYPLTPAEQEERRAKLERRAARRKQADAVNDGV